MNIEQAAKWLDAIKEKYIHGGDDEMDAKRKEAIDMAIRSLEAWENVIKTIESIEPDVLKYVDVKKVVLEIINKALGEVVDESVDECRFLCRWNKDYKCTKGHNERWCKEKMLGEVGETDADCD